MFHGRHNKGISLIEALVALGLFFVFVAGSATLTFRYLNTSAKAIDLNEVRVIAEQSMEAVQSLAYDDWENQMVDGTYGLDASGGSWAFNGASDVVDKYTRSVNIAPVGRDKDCQIVDGGEANDSDTKLVTVIIAWGTSSQSYLRNFSQYFTNWKDPGPCVSPVFFFAIHGNSDVNMGNTTGVVNGDVNSGSSINSGSVVITGDEVDNSPILAPTVDFAAYLAEADHYVSGNHKFTAGTYSGIWYIDGNATIKSNVTFNGTIVATGNVRFVGATNTVFNPVSPYPALLSQGNIEGNNGSSVAINGIAFALGNVIISSSSNVSVYGSMIADGNFEIKNSASLSVTFNEDIPSNPPPHFE